jgi:hypothetical protein
MQPRKFGECIKASESKGWRCTFVVVVVVEGGGGGGEGGEKERERLLKTREHG